MWQTHEGIPVSGVCYKKKHGTAVSKIPVSCLSALLFQTKCIPEGASKYVIIGGTYTLETGLKPKLGEGGGTTV